MSFSRQSLLTCVEESEWQNPRHPARLANETPSAAGVACAHKDSDRAVRVGTAVLDPLHGVHSPGNGLARDELVVAVLAARWRFRAEEDALYQVKPAGAGEHLWGHIRVHSDKPLAAHGRQREGHLFQDA